MKGKKTEGLFKNKSPHNLETVKLIHKKFSTLVDMPTLPIPAGDTRFGNFHLSAARFLKSCRNPRFLRYTHSIFSKWHITDINPIPKLSKV